MAKNNNPGRILKGTKATATLKGASGVWTLDEAMQLHRANAWPQPNLFQPVANSLRIKYQIAGTYPTYQNGYLYRHPGRTGNQYAWTWSAWIKYSQGGIAACILGATTGSAASGDYRTQFIIDKSGSVSFSYAQIQIATYINFVWPLYLRDPSAWYHIVLVFDSLNSTTANRLRLYVNGVQQTATTTTCPQGQVSSINGGVGVSGSSRQSVGMSNDYYGNSAYWYDGLMSEVNFVDGYTLQPTQFGQYDNNNAWVPIPYTGSYGTNGYYLPFTNATTSHTLGYDASLNGTTTYDADQDPYRGSVALHLTGNGPAGGQNNTFVESSPNNHPITRSGSVTQGSFSPFPLPANTPYNPAQHGASAYFGTTTSDNIYASPSQYNNSLAIGTNNFTIEFWANWTAWTGEQRMILMGQSGSSPIEIGRNVGSNTLLVYTNTSLKISYAWSPTIGAWYHIAVVRTGTGAGQLALYINGVSVATGTSADSIAANNFFVGGLNWATGFNMQGYMSNVRVINGAAVYTANFTPTNRPFGTLTNNLITFSEDFLGYGTSQASALAGATIAPDGSPSAFKIVEDTSNNQHGINAGPTVSSGVTYTGSYYIKAAERTQAEIIFFGASATGGNVIGSSFNLISGTVTNSTASATGTIVNVGNGWWRCAVTYTTVGAGVMNVNVFSSTSTTVGGRTYQGNGTSGIFAWGAQLEVASSMGNYVPTPANYSTAPALLLNFANAAVVDTTGAQNFVTVSNATISSSSKYGSGALSFNGSTDYLQSPAVGLNAFGASDFTIEAWISFSSVANGQLVSAGTGSQTNAYYWQYYSSQLQFGVQSVGSVTVVNWTPTANIWYHVCVMRQGPNYYQFVNGQQISVASYSQSWVDGPTYIGYGGAGYFNGKMDDVRITRGVARYSFSGFTPPARALPETGGKSFVTSNINAGIVRSFTTTGTTSWTAPTDVTSVEVLVVAAGGTGAADSATNVGNGGGGAGGVIYNNSYPVTPGQTYTVTVGAGQVGLYANTKRSGGNSQFGNLIAIGGGGGGYYSQNTGADGGSGGGGGSASAGGGAGTAGQGFAGGTASANAGGGGGGAGGTATGTNSRDGGPGLQFGISGTPTYYAGGGGGSASSGAQGTGGIGGGGAAVSGGAGGVNGTANTGGGGGAQINGGAKSGDGGSGVVIVRYTTTAVGNTSDATTDNLVDSPTLYGHDTGAGGEVVGNYATLNPISSPPPYGQASPTLANGNLTYVGVSGYTNADGSIAITSGTFFYEVTLAGTVTDAEAYLMGVNSPGGYFKTAGIRGNGANSGITITTGSTFPYVVGDVIGVAFNYDASLLTYFKNGAQQCTATINGGVGTRPMAAWIQSGGNASMLFHINFGQRAWAYAPPAGYYALTTKNLPRLTNAAATAPNQYFDAVLYTGTGAARSVSGFNFEPDLLWVKDRSTSAFHRLFDRVRGATNSPSLYSNSTSVEGADNLTFTSTGFSYTTDPYSTGMNVNGNLHVVWGWRAGGAAVANTAGSITSQVSANTTSGFSIVSYTGTGVQATVGHGLSTTPSLIILKSRTNATRNWAVYHSSFSAGEFMYLNLTGAKASDNSAWGPITNTTFQLGNGITPNTSWSESGNTFIAYCWSEVPGFSRIGSYTGNGSTDGTFIYCGFKPRWVMVKQATGTNAASGAWQIFDTARDTYNPCDFRLRANDAAAEGTSAPSFDIVSNGFKLRSTNTNWNENAGVYIFMAFAEKPFGNVNGTAR